MLYVKAALAGIAGAIIAVVLWIVVAFVLPIALPLIASRLNGSHGIGAGGATISSGSILLAALFGFATAAYWLLRRG
jgi:hypothetical protein